MKSKKIRFDNELLRETLSWIDTINDDSSTVNDNNDDANINDIDIMLAPVWSIPPQRPTRHANVDLLLERTNKTIRSYLFRTDDDSDNENNTIKNITSRMILRMKISLKKWMKYKLIKVFQKEAVMKGQLLDQSYRPYFLKTKYFYYLLHRIRNRSNVNTMKYIKIRHLNRWINWTIGIVKYRSNMITVKRKYRQILVVKVRELFKVWVTIAVKNRDKDKSVVCNKRLMFKIFAGRCKKLTLSRLKLHNVILESSSKAKFYSLISSAMKHWKGHIALTKRCSSNIVLAIKYYKNYKKMNALQGILYYVDLQRWNKRNKNLLSNGSLKYRFLLWRRICNKEQYSRELKKYFKLKMAKVFFRKMYIRRDNYKFRGSANRIGQSLWLGKYFKRLQNCKLTFFTLSTKSKLHKRASNHYEKSMKRKYWNIFNKSSNRISIWISAGSHKVLSQRAKALSRSLRYWIHRYRLQVELCNIINYFQFCRGFNTFRDKVNSHLYKRLMYSRADLRYKTKQIGVFLYRLSLFAKRSIILRRNFKVFRRLHPVPVCSSCRRILRAWRFEYVLNSKRMKLLHKVSRNKRRLLCLKHMFESWESLWSSKEECKSLARRFFRKLRKVVYTSHKKWLKFQDRFLKVHVDAFSSNKSDRQVQNIIVEPAVVDLMNLAAVGIEYFLDNDDPIRKEISQAEECKTEIPTSRILLRFLTHKILKFSSKRQLDRICVLRRLFRFWSTVSRNQRNFRIELREINERTKIYASTYFAVLNMHKRWILFRSFSMWSNVQSNREKVIKRVLLQQYCRHSYSHWRKVYNDRLIMRNLKPPTVYYQEDIYDFERKKLQSTEKFQDKLVLLKNSSTKKKLRFNDSINNSIIIPTMLSFDENQSRCNTPNKMNNNNNNINKSARSVHWSDLITDDEKYIKKSTRGYLYRHEFRNEL